MRVVGRKRRKIHTWLTCWRFRKVDIQLCTSKLCTVRMFEREGHSESAPLWCLFRRSEETNFPDDWLAPEAIFLDYTKLSHQPWEDSIIFPFYWRGNWETARWKKNVSGVTKSISGRETLNPYFSDSKLPSFIPPGQEQVERRAQRTPLFWCLELLWVTADSELLSRRTQRQ